MRGRSSKCPWKFLLLSWNPRDLVLLVVCDAERPPGFFVPNAFGSAQLRRQVRKVGIWPHWHSNGKSFEILLKKMEENTKNKGFLWYFGREDGRNPKCASYSASAYLATAFTRKPDNGSEVRVSMWVHSECDAFGTKRIKIRTGMNQSLPRVNW